MLLALLYAVCGSALVVLAFIIAVYYRYQCEHIAHVASVDQFVPLCPARKAMCQFDGERITFPRELLQDACDIVVAISVRCGFASRLKDPAIRVYGPGGECWTTFLDRGASGRRYFTIKPSMLHEQSYCVVRLERASLGSHVAEVYAFSEHVTPMDRIFVISPHPDDAEIAAFGLYCSGHSLVLNVTRGELSDRYAHMHGLLPDSTVSIPPQVVARARLLDSMMAPKICENLNTEVKVCSFPDGRLLTLLRRHVAAGAAPDGRLSLPNHGTDGISDGFTWQDVMSEINAAVDEFRPTIVVAPHPIWDSHEDHQACGVAALTASDRLPPDARYFFYVNHNAVTELWPFGPSWGLSSLPPIRCDATEPACRFFSRTLSAHERVVKYLALERMQDVRDVSHVPPATTKVICRRIIGLLSELIDGAGRPKTSYLRRAVRRDEVFFVVTRGEATSVLAAAMSRISPESDHIGG